MEKERHVKSVRSICLEQRYNNLLKKGSPTKLRDKLEEMNYNLDRIDGRRKYKGEEDFNEIWPTYRVKKNIKVEFKNK